MSTIDESGASMADSDINSTDPDGSGNLGGGSTAEGYSGDDVDRGNLDGSNALDEPRSRALDDAGGNGSFDTDPGGTGDSDTSASDVGDSGQDNGLAE
ncbi:MAG TPA: hypothetical protein VFN43_03915 [Humibacillus sp.]|nr:hypothetical protein [Humibacillus sp.]